MLIDPVHFSALKLMAQSPLHYRHALESGRPDSAAMRIGRAAHALILQGIEPITYDARRAGKEWEAFRAAQPEGADILSAAETADVFGMAAAIADHDAASDLIQRATHRELELSWHRDGFSCAGRLDAARAGEYLLDLKTCRSAAPGPFGRAARDMHYDAQLAWYRRGLEQTGIVVSECLLVAVESKPPYAAAVYRVSSASLMAGELAAASWLERLRVCRDADHWPGYSDAILDLSTWHESAEVADESEEWEAA